MKNRIFFTWIAVIALSGFVSTQAASTTNSAAASFGPYVTDNWHSDDFKGTTFRQWDESASSFSFIWNTVAGDQIGSLGVQYGSPYLQDVSWKGIKVSEIKPDCIMSTRAAWKPANSGWFYWSIYGWTHQTYTYWGSSDAPDGYDNEFYVIFYTQETPQTILAQPGCVSKGSVEVDGIVFDCYATLRAAQSQWLAVCRTNVWNPAPSVNLKKIFDYWCSQGLDSNQYIVSLAWAMEGFGGSAGTLELTNIIIPRLRPAQ